MAEPYKFAKLYDTDTGQILITITKYMNAAEIALQFNDGDDGIHRFNLVFANDEQYKAHELFETLDKTTALRMIQKAIHNASLGITTGSADEITELFSPIH